MESIPSTLELMLETAEPMTAECALVYFERTAQACGMRLVCDKDPLDVAVAKLQITKGGKSARRPKLLPNRVLFRLDKKWTDDAAVLPLARQCCGLVVDLRTRRPLVRAPFPLPARAADHRTDAMLSAGRYSVRQLRDGTVLSLYHWDGRWHLASASGYDVSEFRWIGPLTYAGLLVDLLLRLAPKFAEAYGIALEGGRVQAPRLPSDACLVFDMRHANHQPYRLDPEHVVLLASTGAGQCPVLDLEQETDMACTARSVGDLVTTPSLYGFLLIEKDAPHFAVRIESNLLMTLRSLVYDVAGACEDPDDRLHYCAAAAMLQPGYASEFASLFPQLVPYQTRVQNYLHTVHADAFRHVFAASCPADAGGDGTLAGHVARQAWVRNLRQSSHVKINGLIRTHIMDPANAAFLVDELKNNCDS